MGDVHPWLYAYVSLFGHPYFALTDEAGRYRIPLPPKGTYQLRFRHRKLMESATDITVMRNRPVEVVVQMKFSAPGGELAKILIR